MEREKGFESELSPAFSQLYVTSDGDARSSTRPPDASRHVSTQLHAGDTAKLPSALPSLTPDLFIAAGLIVADRAAASNAERSRVEEILRLAVDQAIALRGETA